MGEIKWACIKRWFPELIRAAASIVSEYQCEERRITVCGKARDFATRDAHFDSRFGESHRVIAVRGCFSAAAATRESRPPLRKM